MNALQSPRGQSGTEDANRRRRPLILIAIMLGNFLGGLEATVVGTAMPTVVADLGGLHYYSWVFSVYMLATAVSMPMFGKFSDLFGKKRMFVWAAGLFLLGSGLSGMSARMWQLVVFRAIQGIGAGGTGIVSMSIIGGLYQPQHRARAMGYVSSVWGISSVVGPMLGSLIVTQWGWRWVFYLNLPFGILAILLLTSVYHEALHLERRPIDYGGAVSLTAAILFLLIAFTQIGKGESILAWNVVIMMIIVLLMILYLIVNENRVREPLLPLAYFSHKILLLANVSGFLGGFAIFGVTAFLPLYVQAVRGGTPVDAGLAVMGTSAGWSFSSLLSGQVVHRFGEKKVILAGILSMAAGFAAATRLEADSSMLSIIVSAALVGIGMGTQTPALLAAVQNSVAPSEMGVATSTHMLGRTIGGAIGVSMMGAALTNSIQAQIRILDASGTLRNLPPVLRSKLADPQDLFGSPLTRYIRGDELRVILGAFSSALQNAFLTGLMAVVLLLVLWFAFPSVFPHHEHYGHTPTER